MKNIFFHYHHTETGGVYPQFEWECSLSSQPSVTQEVNDFLTEVRTYTHAEMQEQVKLQSGLQSVVTEAIEHFHSGQTTPYFCQ